MDEKEFNALIAGLDCFYDSDKDEPYSAYASLWTTKKYLLPDGRIAVGSKIDSTITSYEIFPAKKTGGDENE